MSSQTSTVIKQVTRSTFTPALLKTLRSQLVSCDFVSLSSVTTAGGRRVFWFDTPETAYLKAKRAAESYGIVNFSVCPVWVDGSRVIASPYNFHLFPREELKPGLPSYSFSCQSSHLQRLAREGFDFNLCIYEGISYLSRVQESFVGQQNSTLVDFRIPSSSSRSVADALFLERVKSRIKNWRKLQSDSSKSPHGEMTNSLRNIILGTQMYGKRPCMMIDVSNDHQVRLVLQTISGISDSLVPLVAHDNGGLARSIRVVLTSSEEDKSALLSDIERTEEEQNFKLRGFREVIDLISSSQKPIVSYNCLNAFTFIHEKFIAPLPPSMHEFTCSLKMVFPKVLDLGHLMKKSVL